jgi:2-methylcitrate dehydratase PrpD
MSVARTLSELTLNTKNSDIPDSAYEASIKMLLDTIACAYAGADAPGIAELFELEKDLSAEGPASVFFKDKKLALPSAVLCNSAMMHALDFDNNYPGADIHILCIVVPIALACAEAEKVNGIDCLSSIILGVEAAARIAKPYLRAKRQHSYFLTTSLVGGWGGVATAARLRGLTLDETVNAMGIYYAHTCGNRQTLLEKALTKRIQPAIAAKAAMYSVMLAHKGITGPEYAFEGPGGFYNCYTQEAPPDLETFNAPPDPYGIEELVVKEYPTCGIHHGCIAAALELKKEHKLKFEDIERVEFFLVDGGGTLVSMPFSEESMPQISAQFCAPYAIALALNKGEVNICDFSNEAILNDRDTIDLAKRTVEKIRFSDMELKKYSVPRENCRYLKVFLRNNEILEREYSALSFCDPSVMDMPRVEEKFRQCLNAYGETSHNSIDKIIEAVKDFREIEDLGKFLLIMK